MGGATGTRVRGDDDVVAGTVVPQLAGGRAWEYGESNGDSETSGGGVLGPVLVLAPAQASRRSTYVRRPSFHSISSLSRRFLFRFRVTSGWCSESGLSYLYGSGLGSSGVEASEESESRSRHSVTASSESNVSERDDVGGQVQSSRSLERICCLAARTASSFALEVTGLFVVFGCRSDA